MSRRIFLTHTYALPISALLAPLLYTMGVAYIFFFKYSLLLFADFSDGNTYANSCLLILERCVTSWLLTYLIIIETFLDFEQQRNLYDF